LYVGGKGFKTLNFFRNRPVEKKEGEFRKKKKKKKNPKTFPKIKKKKKKKHGGRHVFFFFFFKLGKAFGNSFVYAR